MDKLNNLLDKYGFLRIEKIVSYKGKLIGYICLVPHIDGSKKVIGMEANTLSELIELLEKYDRSL